MIATMWGKQTKVNALMGGVILLGSGALGVSIFQVGHDGWSAGWRLLPLIGLTMLLSRKGTVKVPGCSSQISVSDTIIFVAALLIGPYHGVLLAAADASCQAVKQSKRAIVQSFNIALMALSIFASTVLVNWLFPHILGDALGARAVQLVAPLALLATSHYLVNSLFVASVIALRLEKKLRNVWWENFLWSSISYFAGASAAGMVCLLAGAIGFFSILMVAPIILIIHFTYRTYLDKVETSERHVADITGLYSKVSKAEAAWEATFNAMSDAALMFDCEGKLNRINRAGLGLQRVENAEQVLNHSCCQIGLTCGPERCHVKSILETGKQSPQEIDREDRAFLVTLDPVVDPEGRTQGIVAILKDITEQKRLREQLIQSEKMSAVGQLVSGVAHELNNPLTSVIGYAELAQMDQMVADGTRRNLDIVVQESVRARKIVQNLLTFARQHKAENSLTNINMVISQVVDLRSYEMKVHSIGVDLDLADLPKTMCDGPQLQQVFLNIIINAEHAMLEANGRGRLLISTQQQGNRVVVSIKDDGPGMKPETLKRIFDPFFTTKPVGKGTGLGLSICYGIVEQHGGRLYADSKPGKGTTFFVELPITTQSEVELTQEAERVSAVVPSKKILVVDDEEFITEIVRGLLESEGHLVTTASDGRSALDMMELQHYDLVITDIKMPELTGDALYEQVRLRDEGLARRIIFMSGDTASKDTHEFLQQTGNSFLPKPFRVEELLDTVHSAIACAAA